MQLYNGANVWLYISTYSVIGAVLAILATNQVDKQTMRRLAVFAVCVLIIMALAGIISQAVKISWERPRFRYVDSASFSPWYRINFGQNNRSIFGRGLPDYLKSFPSGHTAGSGVIFALLLLPELFEKLKKYTPWFWATATVYTAAVGLSRLISGHHFLSDVLIGGAITLGVTLLVKLLLKKLLEKNKLAWWLK
jgi:membrane-associated phospholipid phosphatase